MIDTVVEARPAVRALSNSLIREVANAAMGKSNVLPFWFGEADTATPDFVRKAAAESLLSGETFYSQNLGRPYLRETIAAYQSELLGCAIPVEQVLAVGSGMSGLQIAMQLVLSPGDRVVAVTPLWPNISEAPLILGANVERVSLSINDGRWSLDLDKLIDALTPDTRMVIINSPNNPTGWTIDDESVQAILKHCRKHGIWILADEVYQRLVYDPAVRYAPSFLRHYQTGDRIISVNSLSKAWSMTGWRIGWMVIPETLSQDATKLVEYNFSCIFEPTQRAAAVAIKEGESEVLRLRANLTKTRALLVDGLRSMGGVSVPEAGGAMYAFLRIDGYGKSLELAQRLVREVGLGLAPGAAFGPEGEGWLRWCHAVSEDKISEGLNRLSDFLRR
ncbi:pyridoxal phosphate-dependent aminotransferase [Agrobacterium sp. Azo12]|jgi:aspartate aminotransferase|uniref:pyridoxal phosphate-dependent aminotransferase n=1 Tax=Agrobacterium sp. Azo12 TaxID=3031129 RepID=UPI0023D7E023|nr:pyridoxal phosphate-dependent aminotransferase [Agrobacterium sp. Azo12]MDO5898529.1 pyridoxal phosphate-dependent aminotransferase [Agrobacterium sp. Azo12]